MLVRVCKIVSILLLVSYMWGAQAQQEPHFTQHMFSKLNYNPGYAGLRNAICATGIMRQQWVGFTDMEGEKIGPKTYSLSIDMPVKIMHGGIGINVLQDQIGFFTQTNVDLGYAYHTIVGAGDLSIGAQLMFFNSMVDFSKFKPLDEDPLLRIRSGEESDMIFDGNLGVYYRVPDEYWLGVSVQNLFQSAGQNTLFKLSRAYYVAGGYQLSFPTRPFIKVEPSVVCKTDLAAVQVDFNALLRYRDRFWGGVNYRFGDGVGLLFGLWWKDFKLGYSYDITTSKLNLGGSMGSHEVMLGYCFKFEVDRGIRTLRNTRHL
ncbi:MAG: hypothetical protein CSA95_03940 [Bacteroidetes bacterium]|nr:MAG: hypothetical protein CSA95_03940 [Bacteroidota bacterium]PIE88636.1 MAG: hypothetical protein CSA04_00865 [Bacteroidota bacterium]